MNVLSLNNVHKAYGYSEVLKGVNLQLKQGSVMGLIGANGSGKTTLLKTTLGLLKADQGEAQVFNENAWDMSDSSKDKIGFVAQNFDFFNWMKVKQLVDYTSAFYTNWDKQKAAQLMSNWDIDTNQKVDKMSEGQKQRLAIVLALSHSPELLILDEPVASLDPAARRDFIKQLIDMNANSQTSILFSTHITSDIERVAADVAFLKQGSIVYQGEVDQLKEQVVRLHIQSTQNLEDTAAIQNTLSKKVQGQSAKVCINHFEPSLLPLLEQKLNAKIQVENLSLEDIFLELNS
jgi:ABC-2 type transport system ATP-binding protein